MLQPADIGAGWRVERSDEPELGGIGEMKTGDAGCDAALFPESGFQSHRAAQAGAGYTSKDESRFVWSIVESYRDDSALDIFDKLSEVPLRCDGVKFALGGEKGASADISELSTSRRGDDIEAFEIESKSTTEGYTKGKSLIRWDIYRIRMGRNITTLMTMEVLDASLSSRLDSLLTSSTLRLEAAMNRLRV